MVKMRIVPRRATSWKFGSPVHTPQNTWVYSYMWFGNETPVKECPLVSNNIFQSPSMALLGFNNSVGKPLP